MDQETRLTAIAGDTNWYRGYVQWGHEGKDISGDLLSFRLFESESMNVVVEKSSALGGIELHPDGVTSMYRVILDPADLNNLPRREYRFHCRLVDDVNGGVHTIGSGPFVITRFP